MIIDCFIVSASNSNIDVLKTYIEQTSFLGLSEVYLSVADAVESMMTNTPCMVFVDSRECDNGELELVKTKGHDCFFIFVSDDKSLAFDALKAGYFDAILTPIPFPEFYNIASKVHSRYIRQLESNRCALKNCILVKSAHKLVQIDLERILFFEGMVDYVKIVFEDEPKPILSLMSLRNLEKELSSRSFLRVHRSYIVQATKIRTIENNKIIFGKTEIPISDTYKETLMSYFQNNCILGFKL